jgi:hypothetical protein
MNKLPMYAYLKGKGKVRIIAYLEDGYFRVLTSRDEKVFVHRDRLTFTKR